MKIDLSIDLAALDVTEWDLQVWFVVMLVSQALCIVLWLRHELKRQDSPVERLTRRHFGGV